MGWGNCFSGNSNEKSVITPSTLSPLKDHRSIYLARKIRNDIMKNDSNQHVDIQTLALNQQQQKHTMILLNIIEKSKSIKQVKTSI